MKNLFYTLLFTLATGSLLAQDTFSIVAVDPETGAVGAAGASCIDDGDCGGCGGVIIINDLIPGRGGMNSQATACLPNVNLSLGISRLQQGDSPQEAIDYVVANDQCQFGDNTNRQYGIADLDPMGNPRAAAYTGSNCLEYANHITGPNYAIQGNILLGQSILDNMEQGFLNTEGTLAEKLMGALQGANVPGADTRCLNEGVSSLSAFLRVSLPGDQQGEYFLELNVKETPFAREPIDSLQTLFDEWALTSTNNPIVENFTVNVFPNPSDSDFVFELAKDPDAGTVLEVYSFDGKQVYQTMMNNQRTVVPVSLLGNGQLFWYAIKSPSGLRLNTGKLIKQ